MKKETTTVPEGDIVLHACCAPCSGAILESLVRDGVRPTVFFSNSNIWPREEYLRRRDEARRYAAFCGVPFVEDEYDHDAWREAVRGLENEPERGARCSRCFRFRLDRAASFARRSGASVLATTLASSRWKDLDQVNAQGLQACSVSDTPVLRWWPRNWRKGGLQERRGQIIKEQNFYNQSYCGCEFSRRDI